MRWPRRLSARFAMPCLPGAWMPALLLALAVVSPSPAAEFDADKEIRIAERMQQETAVLTKENAEQLLSLLQGYRFNNLADEKTLEAITMIHLKLAALADPATATVATNMPAVATTLLKARDAKNTEGKRATLLDATRGQAAIIKNLEWLVAVARARLGGLTASKTMKALIEEQQKLKDETDTMKAETLGLAADDLDEDLRTDLATMGRTQDRLRTDLADTLEGLLAHAAEVAAFQADYSDLIKRAVAVIRDTNVAGLMNSAAGHITGNQLLRAGREQKQIVTLLLKALKILNEELPVLVIADTGGAPADIGPGPAAGAIDGAFADVPPFEIASDQEQEEYVPGIGRVPLVKGAAQTAPETWLVGLPEKERQILTSAVEERFPDRYRELLKAYYRALAVKQEDEE